AVADQDLKSGISMSLMERLSFSSSPRLAESKTSAMRRRSPSAEFSYAEDRGRIGPGPLCEWADMGQHRGQAKRTKVARTSGMIVWGCTAITDEWQARHRARRLAAEHHALRCATGDTKRRGKKW